VRQLSLLFTFIIINCLVFSLSCMSKQTVVTETYYETEYKTETYVETGQEQSMYLAPAWTRHAWIYFGSLEWAKTGSESYIVGYEIDTAKLSKSRIRLVLSSRPQASLWGIAVINLTGLGPITEQPPESGSGGETVVEGEIKYVPKPGEQRWLDDFNAIVTDPSKVLSFTRSDEYYERDITVDVTGVEEFAVISCVPPLTGAVVERVQLIWSDEVTGDRLVPYQVEKQKTVTKIEKVPFWEVIFSK